MRERTRRGRVKRERERGRWINTFSSIQQQQQTPLDNIYSTPSTLLVSLCVFSSLLFGRSLRRARRRLSTGITDKSEGAGIQQRKGEICMRRHLRAQLNIHTRTHTHSWVLFTSSNNWWNNKKNQCLPSPPPRPQSFCGSS